MPSTKRQLGMFDAPCAYVGAERAEEKKISTA